MARTTKLKPTDWLCVIAALVAALALYANIDALVFSPLSHLSLELGADFTHIFAPDLPTGIRF